MLEQSDKTLSRFFRPLCPCTGVPATEQTWRSSLRQPCSRHPQSKHCSTSPADTRRDTWKHRPAFRDLQHCRSSSALSPTSPSSQTLQIASTSAGILATNHFFFITYGSLIKIKLPPFLHLWDSFLSHLSFSDRFMIFSLAFFKYMLKNLTRSFWALHPGGEELLRNYSRAQKWPTSRKYIKVKREQENVAKWS